MNAELAEGVRAEALSWVGTPFHHNAAIKGVGVDCVHFLIEVFVACRVMERYEPEPYPDDWFLHQDRERFLERIGDYCDPVEPPYEVGDLVLYSLGRCAAHAGIVVGDGQIVHAGHREVQVHDMAHPPLAQRFHSAWRLRPCS